MQDLKKIVVIGPESTGKSTLCRLLSHHYKTIWCPEYARQYLIDNGKNYTYDDLLTIAKGQVALEDDYMIRAAKYNDDKTQSNHPLLFVDTDLFVMKVWCEYVFGSCHTYILDQIATRICDLYLLCDVDLPWVKDELREYPDLEARKELFSMYKDILISQKTPWKIISGNYEERLKIATETIDKTLLV